MRGAALAISSEIGKGRARPQKDITIILAVSGVGRGNRLLRVVVGLSAAGLVTIMVFSCLFSSSPSYQPKRPNQPLYTGHVDTVRGIIWHVFNTATTQLSSSLVPCQFSPPRYREIPFYRPQSVNFDVSVYLPLSGFRQPGMRHSSISRLTYQIDTPVTSITCDPQSRAAGLGHSFPSCRSKCSSQSIKKKEQPQHRS